MKLDDFSIILLTFAVLLGVFLAIVTIILGTNNTYDLYDSNNPTWEKCCGGNMCSDTYYNSEKNVCVLTMCPIWDKTKCEYKPNE